MDRLFEEVGLSRGRELKYPNFIRGFDCDYVGLSRGRELKFLSVGRNTSPFTVGLSHEVVS